MCNYHLLDKTKLNFQFLFSINRLTTNTSLTISSQSANYIQVLSETQHCLPKIQPEGNRNDARASICREISRRGREGNVLSDSGAIPRKLNEHGLWFNESVAEGRKWKRAA